MDGLLHVVLVDLGVASRFANGRSLKNSTLAFPIVVVAHRLEVALDVGGRQVSFDVGRCGRVLRECEVERGQDWIHLLISIKKEFSSLALTGVIFV